MIGIIVLGHAGFASEMLAVIEQVEGTQRCMAAVNYRKGDEKDSFYEAVKQAADSFGNEVGGILLFTDSARGTPYRAAIRFSEECGQYPSVVITGTNLPGLVETALARSYVNDIEMLADLAVEHGKKQVLRFGGAQAIH